MTSYKKMQFFENPGKGRVAYGEVRRASTLFALRSLAFASTFLLLAAAWSDSQAQNLIEANPAEYSDYRSSFVNPAVLSFQKNHVAIGGKVFHTGFVDERGSAFRQGYVSLALPFGIGKYTGVGLQAQYFNSPLYSQSNISLLLARRFNNNYAFGLRVNLFSKSFNQNEFDLVDPNDPVFRNGATKWAGTLGAGVSMFPLPFLSLGLGVDHINRANISLTNDAVYQPFAGYVGAMAHWGAVRVSVSFIYEDGIWRSKTGFGAALSTKGFAMLGFDETALHAEVQYRVAGALSLNYNYEYTLFDNVGVGQGSHAITLIRSLDRPRKLPHFILPDEFRAEFSPPDPSLNPDARFYVYSIIDKVEIVEKNITRKISPEITRQQLAQLTLTELEMLPTSEDIKDFEVKNRPVDLGLIPLTIDALLSEGYRKFVQKISTEGGHKKVRVITPKEGYLRAAGLRKLFHQGSINTEDVVFIERVYKTYRDSVMANQKLGDRPVEPHQTIRTISSEFTVIQITPIENVGAPESWRLIFKNTSNYELYAVSGEGMPPVEIRWDWRDRAGNVVGPGAYSYQLEWVDADGEKNITSKKLIIMQNVTRNITIEVTNHQKEMGVNADEIDIILKR